MTIKSMNNASEAINEIEALLIGKPLPKSNLFRTLINVILQPILFLKFGANELFRQPTFWSLLMFPVMVILVKFWPHFEQTLKPSQPDFFPSFTAAYLGLTVICGLLAFFSIPSRYATFKIDDKLVVKAKKILVKKDLHESRNLRRTMIESLEQTVKSRVNTWLAIAALLWGFSLFLLKSITPSELVSSIDELTDLLGLTLAIWVVVSSYAKGSQKLIYLLKYADSSILDEQNGSKKLN